MNRLHSKLITSTSNQHIKTAALLRTGKERHKQGRFAVEGAREISKALAAGFDLLELFIAAEYLSKEGQAVVDSAYAKGQGFTSLDVDAKCFDKLVMREGKDGVYAVFKDKQATLNELSLGKNPLILCLEGVEKPGNLGALLRCADGAGAAAVMICTSLDHYDLYHPHTIRASLGTVFSLPVIMLSPEQALEFFQQHAIKTVAAALHPQSQPFTKVDLSASLAILLGSEAQGLSAFWLEHAEEKVILPMLGTADSLNVAAAGAVLLYEARRQRSS